MEDRTSVQTSSTPKSPSKPRARDLAGGPDILAARQLGGELVEYRGRFGSLRFVEGGIDGRSDDVFHYREVTVHPHVFRSVLSRHLEVRDYAVRQVERGAVVQIQATTAFDTEGLAAELRLALARAGLLGPDVSVSVVDALERTAIGKRRHFIAA